MGSITRVVNDRKADGDTDVVSPFQKVFTELRRLAASRLTRERSGLTLQPTALVNEAWMRLARQMNAAAWDSRAHFFAAAAEAMRRVLIDHARSKSAGKRQPAPSTAGKKLRSPTPELSLDELLDLDSALKRLESVDPAAAELVRLRLFTGLTTEESARALSIPERTAYRNWKFAQAWLYRELHISQETSEKSPD